MREFTPYAVGLCRASVCTSLPKEEVAARMNMVCPTGIDTQWTLAPNSTFGTGEPNPCPCSDSPDTHKHYLLHC
jgi:hypothetical protein